MCGRAIGENLRRCFPTAFDGTELSNVFNGVCVPGSFDGFLLFQKNPKPNLFGVFSRESVVGLLEVRPRSGTLPCLLPKLYRFFSLLCSVKFQQIFHFFLTHKRTHTHNDKRFHCFTPKSGFQKRIARTFRNSGCGPQKPGPPRKHEATGSGSRLPGKKRRSQRGVFSLLFVTFFFLLHARTHSSDGDHTGGFRRHQQWGSDLRRIHA